MFVFAEFTDCRHFSTEDLEQQEIQIQIIICFISESQTAEDAVNKTTKHVKF